MKEGCDKDNKDNDNNNNNGNLIMVDKKHGVWLLEIITVL